ncbi:MAG: SHOCT domain-containing protein [Clostridia bacterium]|nr:SHOCT domain-containing protein [Clostridia bacterium]
MGFFAKNCYVCNKKTSFLTNCIVLSKSIWICRTCFNKVGGSNEYYSIIDMKPDEIKKMIELNEEKLKNFNPTQKVKNYLYIDENKKQWGIPQTNFFNKVKYIRIYEYSDIVSFELIEDGNTITKGGTARAVLGGALFGDAGAIAGGVTARRKSSSTCSKLQIKITLNSLSNPVVYINFIETEYRKDSVLGKEVYESEYSLAQKALSVLNLICDSNSDGEIEEEEANYSKADEIKKFKELLDMGAITQEEYEEKKKDLLK